MVPSTDSYRLLQYFLGCLYVQYRSGLFRATRLTETTVVGQSAQGYTGGKQRYWYILNQDVLERSGGSPPRRRAERLLCPLFPLP